MKKCSLVLPCNSIIISFNWNLISNITLIDSTLGFALGIIFLFALNLGNYNSKDDNLL